MIVTVFVVVVLVVMLLVVMLVAVILIIVVMAIVVFADVVFLAHCQQHCHRCTLVVVKEANDKYVLPGSCVK